MTVDAHEGVDRDCGKISTHMKTVENGVILVDSGVSVANWAKEQANNVIPTFHDQMGKER